MRSRQRSNKVLSFTQTHANTLPPPPPAPNMHTHTQSGAHTEVLNFRDAVALEPETAKARVLLQVLNLGKT